MACGKPVISTELGTGTSFVNQHKKTGLVVKPNSVVDLRDAIYTILNNKNIREDYGINAKERVIKHFSADIMASRIINEYQMVLKKKK